MTASIPDHHVVVIGSGVGGLCAGVRLKQAGIEDFVIIDRAADLGVPGGTMYTRESRWISRR